MIDVVMLPDWRQVNPYQELLRRALEARGINVRFPRGYRRGLPITRALLTQPRPDLFHLHWPSAFLRSDHPIIRRMYLLRTLVDLWCIRRAGIPIVWTVHNLVTHDTRILAAETWFSARLARLADRLIVHSASAQVAVTKELKVAADKTVIIPHGPLRDAYGDAPDKSRARSILELPKETPVVLFFGLIRPYKGVLNLLDAWAQMSDKDRQGGTLLVVGDASDPGHAAEVRTRAAKTPATRLDMRFIQGDEIPVLMAAADLLVLPFHSSLTSGTVNMAMEYGLPVVVPRTPGTAEVRVAILAEDTGPRNLGAAIVRGLTTRLDNFGNDKTSSWNDIARSHAQVYEQVFRDDGTHA